MRKCTVRTFYYGVGSTCLELRGPLNHNRLCEVKGSTRLVKYRVFDRKNNCVGVILSLHGLRVFWGKDTADLLHKFTAILTLNIHLARHFGFYFHWT